VLLIVDVHTTGATLAWASSALEAAGCPEVIALALAAAAG
jgi:predicted amidophosphoribosyltransferase